MMDPGDVLTWQGLQKAADYSVCNPGGGIVIVPPKHPAPLVGRDGGRWFCGPEAKIVPPAGSVLFARDAWRAPWRKELAALPNPVVIVSAFNDCRIKPIAVAELLASPTITRWFGVQAETSHPKLTPMPVGIDGRMVPHLKQAVRRPWHERDIQVLVNFNRERRGREEAWAFWSQHPWATVVDWDDSQPQAYAGLLGRAQFVVSPPGHGWDCYRTHEALTMGAVPLLIHGQGAGVVGDLPVACASAWEAYTPTYLADLSYVMSHCDWHLARLTASYWLGQIRAAAVACQETLIAQ